MKINLFCCKNLFKIALMAKTSHNQQFSRIEYGALFK